MKKTLKALAAIAIGTLTLTACSSGGCKYDTTQSPLDSFKGEVAASTGDPNPAITGKFGEEPKIEAGKGDAPKELKKWIITEGEGRKCSDNAIVLANYHGQLWDGNAFDSTFDIKFQHNTPMAFSLDGVVKGWKEGLTGVKVGSRVLLVVPPDLGYGDKPQGKLIPANSTLVFAVDVLDCVNPKDTEKLKDAKPLDNPPAGIKVTGELGAEPKVEIGPDAKLPEKMTLVVLAEGNGPVIGPDDFPVFHETDVLWDDPTKSQSTYKTGMAQQLQVKASSEQLGDHKTLFIGQKIGTRLLVISPKNPQTGQPNLVSILDFTNKLSPKPCGDK